MQELAMADSRKALKTENLSLRLDPKTKFSLDFIVRIKGVRPTDLVARAIKDMADSIYVQSGGVGYDDLPSEKGWVAYWHPDEGVRTLNLILDRSVPTSFDEDELAEFVRQHWEFFYTSKEMVSPVTPFIQVLWPEITKYLDHWRENKSKSRWVTGELMLRAIKAADMRGPAWPPQSKPSVPKSPKSDFDDEIPF